MHYSNASCVEDLIWLFCIPHLAGMQFINRTAEMLQEYYLHLIQVDINFSPFNFAVISSGFGSGFDWILFCNHVIEARWVDFYSFSLNDTKYT